MRGRTPAGQLDPLAFGPALLRPPRQPAQAFQRRHPHERNYANDPGRNASYRDALRRLAERLAPILAEARTLVYAPLRGAWPIWKAVSIFLPPPLPDVYFPVTSSFVCYPESWQRRNDKGRPGSGRLAHRLELARLLPLLEAYRQVVYLDEIVSGGVMAAYLDEFVRLGIPGRLRVVAAGIADDFGRRSQAKRARIGALVNSGVLRGLLSEGCSELITEDNKFLLGIHYTDYGARPERRSRPDRVPR